MRDLTVHRCKAGCGRVARWKRGDDWFCRDDAPYSAEYIKPPPLPPPPKLDYEVIGQASVRVRVRRTDSLSHPPDTVQP